MRTPDLSPGPNGGRGKRPFPVLTISLIAVGALVFIVLPEAGQSPSACLSVEDLDILNLVLVTVAGVFVHPQAGHLVLHVALLAYFGVLLERRLGSGRPLAAVLLGSVLAALINLNGVLDQGPGIDPAGQLIRLPPVGFAGAVAGLMGLFTGGLVHPLRPMTMGDRSRALWPKPSAAIGAALIALFMLRELAAWGPAWALIGFLGQGSLAGAFLGGLGVGVVAVVVDRDADSGGLRPEKTEGALVGGNVSRRPAVRMIRPARMPGGGAEMLLQRR
jgi:membrane associated rhomboid family serine protease